MIAIVGAGASGILAAAQIGLQATSPCRVVLYDSSEFPTGGLAYGTRNLAHLLNVPAGKISALPNDPGHFLQWLSRPGNVAGLLQSTPPTAGDFLPRAIFGCYLFDLLDEVYSRPECVARLEFRHSRAVDFIPTRYGGTIVSADGETEDVGHVILALGNLPPRDPLSFQHPFFRSSRYVPLVWAQGAIATQSPDDDILLVGTGLTAVDVILALESSGHRGKYYVTSRGGRWPQPHGPSAPYTGTIGSRLPWGSTRQLVRLVREEIKAHGPENWRAVVDALRPHTQELWKKSSLPERRRFLRHARTLWESHRHRMPQQAWKVLARLREEGRLELIPGRLKDFTEDGDGVTIDLQTKQPVGRREIRVQKVFNCIGPESNFRQHFNDPLLINLLARGVLHPDPLMLGLEATETFQVVGPRDRIFEQISLIGPPLKGMLWESTAIPEIRQQAVQVAHNALQHHLHTSWEI